MLRIAHFETGHLLMCASTKRDRLRREIDAADFGGKAVREERDRPAPATSDIENSTVPQIGPSNQLKGKPDGIRIENSVRHFETGLVAFPQTNVTVVEKERRFAYPRTLQPFRDVVVEIAITSLGLPRSVASQRRGCGRGNLSRPRFRRWSLESAGSLRLVDNWASSATVGA